MPGVRVHGALRQVVDRRLRREGIDQARGLFLRPVHAVSKPVVLLIDEIDTLIGDTLIAVLRQLRAGYDLRPSGFPQSVVLCGVRNS